MLTKPLWRTGWKTTEKMLTNRRHHHSFWNFALLIEIQSFLGSTLQNNTSEIHCQKPRILQNSETRGPETLIREYNRSFFLESLLLTFHFKKVLESLRPQDDPRGTSCLEL